MSFSERDINTIHSNTSFVNGRKYFGQFDSKVTSRPTIERILGNQDLKTEATIFKFHFYHVCSRSNTSFS